MEKDIIEIIKDKSFYELDSSEKNELMEYCSNEDEFNQLKQAFIAVEAASFSAVLPQAKTKERLDDLFVQKYPQAAPLWYNSILAVVIPKEKPIYKQPLMQIAAVVALLFLTVPFFNVSLKNDRNLVAENKIEQTEKELVVKDDSNKQESSTVSLAEEKSEDYLEVEVLPVQQKLPAESPTGWLEVSEDVIETEAILLADDLAPTASTIETTFNHPDGVFMDATEATSTEVLSISVADSEDLMDLLVATF